LIFLLLVGLHLLWAPSSAAAGFLDEPDFREAIAELRAAIGEHPRALKIEVNAKSVQIEAQDLRNRQHVDLWRYETLKFGIFSMRRVAGPQAVELQLLDPDLEANLFDLDSVDFTATTRLAKAAIERAHIQDPALVTRMEIARRTFLLPKPTAGDIRWTLSVASEREHASIYADAKGAIIGADLAGTRRAQSLDLFKEPTLLADAAAAFRAGVGSELILTSVGIDSKSVGFTTNLLDKSFGQLAPGMPANSIFTWNLNGLQRRLGSIDVSKLIDKNAPAVFGIGDVDWSVLAKLAADALARVANPRSQIRRISVAKSSDVPGGPMLAWTVEIIDAEGEVTSVVADTKGMIQRVILPPSRRPKIDWREPASRAGAISRITTIFGPNASIASIFADERGGRFTIDDPANGGKATTFDFEADGMKRAAISFSLDSMGPRFVVGDLSSLTEQKLSALQADALKRLGAKQKVYLDSISIGPHPFARQAGPRAIEVRVRDIPKDSAQAHYAWVVYNFEGRMLDFVTP
jgi:hypothetical protein